MGATFAGPPVVHRPVVRQPRQQHLRDLQDGSQEHPRAPPGEGPFPPPPLRTVLRMPPTVNPCATLGYFGLANNDIVERQIGMPLSADLPSLVRSPSFARNKQEPGFQAPFSWTSGTTLPRLQQFLPKAFLRHTGLRLQRLFGLQALDLLRSC